MTPGDAWTVVLYLGIALVLAAQSYDRSRRAPGLEDVDGGEDA